MPKPAAIQPEQPAPQQMGIVLPLPVGSGVIPEADKKLLDMLAIMATDILFNE